MKEREFIRVTLTSPDAIIWKGHADTVTSENSEGLFDLYPDHARFMTLLEDVDLIIRPSDEAGELNFHIDKAVLIFQDGTLKIYLHKHIDPKPK